MSFALEYRKKLQQQEHEAVRAAKVNKGFVTTPSGEAADTRRNGRRVLAALVIAGGVLGVFNSGALVRYTQDLAGNPIGEKLIELSERWHEVMQAKQVTRVVEEIRGSLTMAQEASWRDLTARLGITPSVAMPETNDELKVVPAGGNVPSDAEPDEKRKAVTPAGPVMRASVERPPR